MNPDLNSSLTYHSIEPSVNRYSSSVLGNKNGTNDISLRYSMVIPLLFLVNFNTYSVHLFQEKFETSAPSKYSISYQEFSSIDTSKYEVFNSFINKIVTQTIDLETEYQTLINENIDKLLW